MCIGFVMQICCVFKKPFFFYDFVSLLPPFCSSVLAVNIICNLVKSDS